MKVIIKYIIFLCFINIKCFGFSYSDSSNNSNNFQKNSFEKRIELLEQKSSNYESLISMQGAFYQTLIAIMMFVFGLGGWAIVRKEIKKVKFDNDERVKKLRTAITMNLGDMNNNIGNKSYESNDYYNAFITFLQGARYLHEGLIIYNSKKSLFDFLKDTTNDNNIQGLTGKLLIQLEQVELISNNYILKGEYDNEIANNYSEIILKFNDLCNCAILPVADKSKNIMDQFVKYVNEKQLLNS